MITVSLEDIQQHSRWQSFKNVGLAWDPYIKGRKKKIELNSFQVLLMAFSVQLQRAHRGPGPPRASCFFHPKQDENVNPFIYNIKLSECLSSILNHTNVDKCYKDFLCSFVETEVLWQPTEDWSGIIKAGTRDVFTLCTEQRLNLVGHWNFKDNVKYHLSVANTYHDYEVLQTYFNHIVASKIYWQYSGALQLCFDFFM